MANAHANKVVINGVTKIDLTADTVDAEHLMQGYTAHDKTGALIVGTATGGGGKKAVTIKGGINENVSWTGTETGSTNLGSSGEYGVLLNQGSYTFTFSISNSVTGVIAVTIDDNTTEVCGWGNRNPVYWFGRRFGHTTGSSGGTFTPSYNTNYIAVSTTGSTKTTFYFNGVSKGSKAIAKAYVDTTGKYNSSFPKAQIYGSSVSSYLDQAAGQTGVMLEGTISADSTLGVTWRASSSTTAGGLNIYALWLE